MHDKDKSSCLSLDWAKEAFKSLNHAIAVHAEWLINWNRELLCGKHADLNNFIEINDCHCGIGCWLKNNKEFYQNDNGEFKKACLLHRVMHKNILNLLDESKSSLQVSHDVYNIFIKSEKELTESIIGIRDEIFRQLFSFDFLTKVMTRQSIYNAIFQEHSRVIRRNEKGCVAFVDLDHFKKINDVHGHIVGDQVLVCMAEFLIEHLRPYDSIGRFGGEEFLILLPHTSTNDAKLIMQRLISDLNKEIHQQNGKYNLPTISIGIAPFSTEFSLSDILDQADKALYESKKQGRNRVNVWKEVNSNLNREVACNDRLNNGHL